MTVFGVVRSNDDNNNNNNNAITDNDNNNNNNNSVYYRSELIIEGHNEQQNTSIHNHSSDEKRGSGLVEYDELSCSGDSASSYKILSTSIGTAHAHSTAPSGTRGWRRQTSTRIDQLLEEEAGTDYHEPPPPPGSDEQQGGITTKGAAMKSSSKEVLQSSNVTAFVTLLKALFGVSLLSSPRVLSETGIILGTLVYGLIVMAVVGSCWCLLQARAKVAYAASNTNTEYASSASSSTGTRTSSNNNNNNTISSTRPSLFITDNGVNQQQITQTQFNSSHHHPNNSNAQQQPPRAHDVIRARHGGALTYGDLGRVILGAKQSTLISFLIVSLHILFGAGLVSTSIHQIAIVLGWETPEYNDNNNKDDNQEEEDEEGLDVKGRIILASIIFPIICVLLQFRNIKDLFWVCLAGILVFLVGCVGTMVYSSTMVDDDGDGSYTWEIPHNAFEWRWSGIPNFVASTLCAMEGINLALPIANYFYTNIRATNTTDAAVDFQPQQQFNNNRPPTDNNKNSKIGNVGIMTAVNSLNNDRSPSPVPVVTAAVSVFGVTTLLVAYFGYLSGFGGGGGDHNDSNDNEDNNQDDNYCSSAAQCLDSEVLKTIHRVSLAATLILTLPIILYPSLELLELWAEERHLQLKTGKTMSDRNLGDSWNGFVMGAPSDSLRRTLHIEEAIFGVEPYFQCLHKHWRYRISHAGAVCLLAIVDRQWERGLVLYKGIGLSIACFLLPVLLFVKAYTVPVVLQQPGLVAALSGLVALGLVNFVLVALSVFTDHNFMPSEIHDDPLHHNHDDNNEGESGDHNM